MQNYYIQISPDGDPIGHPVSEQNLKQVYSVEFSEKWQQDSGYHLIENNPPEIEANQSAERTGTYAIKEGGGYEWAYEVITYDQDYLTNRFIRIPRVQLLLETDWAVLPDSPLSDADKQTYIDYRQSLRDLTSTYPNVTSADDVTWPTPPWAYDPAPIPEEESDGA